MHKKIENLKKIPLAELCIQQLGYVPDVSKDSKVWRCLVSPSGHKIVTKSYPNDNGDYLFFEPNSDKRGSIVNLLTLLHGYSYLDILVEFCGEKMKVYNVPVYSELSTELSPKKCTKFVENLYKKYIQRCTISGHNYLTKRGINLEIINHFKLSVAERELFLPLYFLEAGKWQVATAIRYFFDANNEKKQLFLKGCKKRGAYSLLTPLKRPPEYFSTLNIFESPIDALSYAQLFPDKKNAIFMSFCGGFGTNFKLQLASLFKRLNITYIYICMDNDDAGRKFANELQNIVKKYNFCKVFPKKKDWNEELNFK